MSIKTFFQNNRVIMKILFITALMLALLIPQTSIMQLTNERQSWKQHAINDISKSWPGKQTLAGPFLKIPYTVENQANSAIEWSVYDKKQRILLIQPKQLSISGNINTSLLKRGIYHVPIYNTDINTQGTFDLQKINTIEQQKKTNEIIHWGKPKLEYYISDARGIHNSPTLNWDNQEIDFKPGITLSSKLGNGMHSELPESILTNPENKALPFSFKLSLKGMQALHFSQAAENISINMESDWLHPSFTGQALPTQRDINENGFSASWHASSFSQNNASALDKCATGECRHLLMNNTVGVKLIQPVDAYQLSNRSVKYAQLFIFLMFIALVLFELFRKLQIHPVQYLLVSIELTVFYLLLLSLSEHLTFGIAYAIASLASTGILTIYFTGVLKELKAALLLGSSVMVLYLALFGILNAEDHALLMGSLLIFSVIALLMIGTRNIDWYTLSGKPAKTTTPATHEGKESAA